MKKETLNEITATLQNKYPDVGIQSIEVNEKTGQSTFYLQPTKKSLAFIDEKKGGGVIPRTAKERAAVITRDYNKRADLDLFTQFKTTPYEEDPKTSIERAIAYYFNDPMVGSTVNVLASLAQKGFENDIDDENIKQFYDVWAFDVNLEQTLEWIFLDFFKYGHVTTYKVIGKYEPRVSYLSPIPGQKMKTNKKTASEEHGAKKNIWSKGHMPQAYTVLNPSLVEIEGNLLFDNVSVKITLPPEMRQLMQKPSSEQTIEEKELIKMLPPDIEGCC
jgi:hypothetical protein